MYGHAFGQAESPTAPAYQQLRFRGKRMRTIYAATGGVAEFWCDRDVDPDHAPEVVDAVIALRIAVGSREYDQAADVSGDGRVTSLDALMILQAASV